MSRPPLSRQQIQELVRQYADQFQVPYPLAISVLEQESDYFPLAESEAGAKGLMQLMPLLIKEYEVKNPFDEEESVRAGVEHLGYLFNIYDGDPRRTLAAYFAGETDVNKAQGLGDLGPLTQKYVHDVSDRMAAQEAPQGVAPPSPTESPSGPIKTRWIYPRPLTQAQFDAMVDDDGKILPKNHPDREGIQISYAGPDPTLEDIAAIFQTVDPEGFITRDDAASLAALGTSGGAGALNLAKRWSPALRGLGMTGTKLIPGIGWGLTLGSGLAGAGGELWRQQQIPRDVGRFGIESWPRSRFGMHYEGVPDTPWESAYSAGVMGLQEAVGEGLGGLLAKGARRVGSFWKGTGFDRGTRLASDQKLPQGGTHVGSPSIGEPTNTARILSETGTGPTVASADRAQEMVNLGSKAADDIIQEAQRAAGNDLLIDRAAVMNSKLFEDLSRRAGLEAQAAHPQLLNELTKLEDSFRFLGPEVAGVSRITQPPMPVALADDLRKQANRFSASKFDQLGQAVPGATTAASDVQHAFGRSLREQIQEALRRAESAQGGSFTNRLGGGRTGRFSDRWDQQVQRTGDWLTASQQARVGARQGMPGVLQGGLAFGPPAAAASMVATGSLPGTAGLLGGSLGGLALSQLSPTGRSALGGALYRAGSQFGQVPVNIGRALQITQSPSGLDPRPATATSPGIPPRPQYNIGPLQGRSLWDALSNLKRPL